MKEVTQQVAVSVETVLYELKRIYQALDAAEMSMRHFPAFMLWGRPGLGKSDAIREFAEFIHSLGKKVNLIDVRLALFSPIDLRGVPVPDEEHRFSNWLRPKIFDMIDAADVVNILFLDEVTSAPQSVQAAAYQMVLDRAIGEHAFPDNCIVLAAGNRTTDRSVAYHMPDALANRFLHMQVEVSFPAWKNWAIQHGIHGKVLGYLNYRPGKLLTEEHEPNQKAFATPRTWERVSDLLHLLGGEPEEIQTLIAGCIGVGEAMEFVTWCRVYHALPSLEEIFAGISPRLPKNSDCLYALTAAMGEYVQTKEVTQEELAHSVRYALQMPPDFTAVLFQHYLQGKESVRSDCMAIPEFARWVSKNRRWF